MKTLVATTLIAATVPATAAISQSNINHCTMLASVARATMAARQHGASKSKMLEAAQHLRDSELARATQVYVRSAFSYPVVDGEKFKRQVAKAAGEGAFEGCLEHYRNVGEGG